MLAARDALEPGVSLAPPPVDSRLTSPVRVNAADECRDSSPAARLQIGAHAVGSGGDAQMDATHRHSVLDVCDVSDLVAALAPRPVKLENLIDGLNKRVPANKCHELLQPALARYEKFGLKNLHLPGDDSQQDLPEWFSRKYQLFIRLD